MNEHPKKYGRTFYDLVTEHPKTFFFLTLLVITVTVFLLVAKGAIKIGNFEISLDKRIVRDTVIQYQKVVVRDTIYLARTNKLNKEDNNKNETGTNVQSYNQSGGQTAGDITNNY